MTISILDFPYNIKYQNKIPLILFLIFMVSGCNPKSDGEDFEPKESSKIDRSELCYLKFYRIDNQVKIYVNGEEVFDSGIIHKNPELNKDVSLSGHLTEGKNEIKIDLYNGNGTLTDSFDEFWEVYYEVIYQQVPVDYMHEQSSSGKTGLVYSKTHEITID